MYVMLFLEDEAIDGCSLGLIAENRLSDEALDDRLFGVFRCVDDFGDLLVNLDFYPSTGTGTAASENPLTTSHSDNTAGTYDHRNSGANSADFAYAVVYAGFWGSITRSGV